MLLAVELAICFRRQFVTCDKDTAWYPCPARRPERQIKHDNNDLWNLVFPSLT